MQPGSLKLAMRVCQPAGLDSWPASRVVLVDVPERAVVDRVDVHRGVVAPARVGRRLHAGAVDDRRPRPRVIWPSGSPASRPGVADAGKTSSPLTTL